MSDPASPAPDGAKRYLTGTHRIMDPDATLASVVPHAPRMGITRIAVLTGLDVLGIPVVAAVRPNSRSIAVHQGKGVTLSAAKASAVMEAAETLHAETHRAAVAPGLVRRTGGRTRRIRRCCHAAPAVRRATIVCCGSRHRNSCPVAPLGAARTGQCRLHLSAPPGAGLFQATTNGLASGNHWLEAVLHGLYEVVERDAIALWRAASDAAQNRTAVDLDSVDAPVSRTLLQAFRHAGVALRVWDVTSDIRLPSFLCLAASDDGVEPELGSGCHADADIALSRALTEAAQARLTRISGARDDFAEASYRPAARAGRQEAARRWLRAPATRAFRAAPDCAGADAAS